MRNSTAPLACAVGILNSLVTLRISSALPGSISGKTPVLSSQYILIFDLPSVVTGLFNMYIQSSNPVQLEPAAVGKDHTGHQPMYLIYMQHLRHSHIICHLDHESVVLSQLAA